MRRLLSLSLILVLILILIPACANGPEAAPENENLPQSVIRETFAWRLDPNGAQRPDREVLRINKDEIHYREDSSERSLAFADIALVSIEAAELQERGVENLRLYLVPDSASVTSASATSGMLGLGKPFVRLARRPIGAESRLRKALSQLAALRPDKPEPQPGPAPAPSPQPEAALSDEEVEAKLRKLKSWHEEGLISTREYEAAKRSLLRY